MTYLDIAVEVFRKADPKKDPQRIRTLARIITPGLNDPIPPGQERFWRAFFRKLYKEVGRMDLTHLRECVRQELARN